MQIVYDESKCLFVMQNDSTSTYLGFGAVATMTLSMTEFLKIRETV